MKTKILSILIFFLLSLSCPAQDNLSIDSKILNKKVNYSISLPPDYSTGGKSYPVLYLLHGYGTNNTIWLKGFKVDRTLQGLVSSEQAKQMIIIMPDGGTSWYINGQTENYEDFFFKEFVPQIESQYRILSDKTNRSIAGISMGGYGALLYTLKHPQMFGSCVAMSAGVLTKLDVTHMPDQAYGLFASPFGARTSEKWRENDIFSLVKNLSKEQRESLKFYIDCGDDDFLYRGNSELHVAMRDASVPHEYRVRDGGHTSEYWIPMIPEMFKFVSK